MKETWKNFDEYWKSVIERKVHVVSEIVMDPNARGNKLKLCKAVWEACAESYRCPHITGNPEGSQWCQLAESSVTAMGNEIAKLKEEIEELNTVIAKMRHRHLDSLEPLVREVMKDSRPMTPEERTMMNEFLITQFRESEMKDDSLGEKSGNTPQL